MSFPNGLLGSLKEDENKILNQDELNETGQNFFDNDQDPNIELEKFEEEKIDSTGGNHHKKKDDFLQPFGSSLLDDDDDGDEVNPFAMPVAANAAG